MASGVLSSIGAEMQKAAGLTNPRVYHSADSNKSEIVVVFDLRAGNPDDSEAADVVIVGKA